MKQYLNPGKKLFIIIGVGGTGSLIARDIPKLIIGSFSKMMIVDGDRVEEKNMKRQSYQEQDIGENKAIALSKKINSLYGPVCYFYEKYITDDELYYKIKKETDSFGLLPVMIGCVDNDSTRILLEKTFKKLENAVYIDSANSEYDGNVYVSVKLNEKINGPLRGDTYVLENENHPLDKSCMEQAASGNTQYLVTNLKMATAIFEHCNSIMMNIVETGVTHVRRFETVHYE